MKKVITITLLLILNACGSEDHDKNDDALVVESSISTGDNVCNAAVDCFDSCGSNSNCAEKCFSNLSGDDIEKSFILMTCRETHADACITETCEESECGYAVDICEGEKVYGCAEVLECIGKCFTDRCETECQNIGTASATAHLESLKTCVVDYCAHVTSTEELNACLKTNCKGSILACKNN